ncbi:MAG: PIN domain-containing protein [Coprococcus sp.]
MKYMLDTNICIYVIKHRPPTVIQNFLKFDHYAAEEYGKIRAELERNGTPIGPMDMLIAGHARSKQLILVTNNTREFNRVEDLEVEDWTIE